MTICIHIHGSGLKQREHWPSEPPDMWQARRQLPMLRVFLVSVRISDQQICSKVQVVTPLTLLIRAICMLCASPDLSIGSYKLRLGLLHGYPAAWMLHSSGLRKPCWVCFQSRAPYHACLEVNQRGSCPMPLQRVAARRLVELKCVSPPALSHRGALADSHANPDMFASIWAFKGEVSGCFRSRNGPK